MAVLKDETRHEAAYYLALENGAVCCKLCPHHCRIPPGREGLCGVRGNRDGVLYALTYARVVSAASDPIEKKPLYHFFPGASTLSLGSVGCNLHCLHCQNWQISRCTAQQGKGALQHLEPAVAVRKTRQSGAEILVFTYNEPSLWFEYLLDCARLAKPQGIKIVLVTSGMIDPQPLRELLPWIDAYRVDIKGFSGELYKKLTGFDVLERVLANASSAYRAGVHLEVVTNLIPGWNDDDTQLRGLARWICDEMSPDVPWHLTRYFPCHRLNAPATPMTSLEKGLKIANEEGVRYTYLGNVSTAQGSDTHCANCGALLIERRGYSLGRVRLSNGACPDCTTPLGHYRDR